MKKTPRLAISALGVVFGDIGTSPLYALRETLDTLPVSVSSILGILSLIFWSLVLIISIKYLIIIFRADNDGEGGMFALLALLKQHNSRYEAFFSLLAIFGAGLLLGDGMLTPAISVVAATEGLTTMAPSLHNWVLPLTCTILLFLFLMQSRGTGNLGDIFGPLLLVWFIVIGTLGLVAIYQAPFVLRAINPLYAIQFLAIFGFRGYLLLGGIFLVVTGGEALYADIGHFGKSPIRWSWSFIVFPALVLNYFGQGAYLLVHPGAITNPFFLLAPTWFSIPLLILATLATVIASHAVISATFSLMKQGILLGFLPKLHVVHTSKDLKGQIYMPQINFLLACGTFVLLFTFKDSSNLAHAYGIAVNMDMLLITSMVAYTARYIWDWSIPKIFTIFSVFLIIDSAFLGANFHKFLTGGWVPVLFALSVAFIMYTWNAGLHYLEHHVYMKKESFDKILKQLNYKSLNHLKGVTSIFITDTYNTTGGSFLHFLKLSRSVPEHILIVNHTVENVPYVHRGDRYRITLLNETVCQLMLSYGFMDIISIPHALQYANDQGILPFPVDVNTATYIVELLNVIASKRKRSLLFYLQEKLFAFLVRNYSSNLNIEFYKLPHNRTIGIGAYCLL